MVVAIKWGQHSNRGGDVELNQDLSTAIEHAVTLDETWMDALGDDDKIFDEPERLHSLRLLRCELRLFEVVDLVEFCPTPQDL